MTWLRTDDGDCWDPRLVAIIRNRGEHHRALGMRAMLREHAAAHRTDGYLSGYVVRGILSPRWLARFCDPPDGGVALLHRRADHVDGARFCECLKSADWPPGADYAVHGYLDTNPSRDEVDVARAKAAELRDRELRVQVRHRDRDRCRYCGTAVRWADHRSGQGGVLDHVDPSYAAGAANLVVACRNCNSRKGNRTPAQADMVLLDPPADPVPDPAPTRGTGAGPTTHVPARDGTVTGPRPSPPPLQLDLTGGELTGAAGLTGNGEPPRSGGEGGAGDVDNVGPARTRRTRTRPNPYLRSGSTGPAPENHAGLPGPDAGPSAFDPPGYDPPDYDPPGFDPPGYDADEDPGWPPPDPQAPP